MLTVYSKSSCPSCDEVKTFLTKNNIEFEVKDVTNDGADRDWILSQGFRSIPQVFDENGTLIGDCDKTIKHFSK